MKRFLSILVFACAFAGAAFAQVAPTPVPQGSTVTLTVSADGTQPFTYQWLKGGVAIPGATSASLVIASFSATDAATYSVTIANSAGSISTTAVLDQQILPPSNPKISVVQKLIAWIKAFFKIFV